MDRSWSFSKGAALGTLLTAPLLAVFYLAEQVFGLPFPPFALFDWLARTLPGDIVVRSIEAMVDLIRRFDLGETSGTAKTLETLAALLIFFGGGVLAAMFLLISREWLAGRGRLPQGLWAGGLAGALTGVPVVAISLSVDGIDTAPAIVAIWLLLVFAAWGALLYWLAGRWPAPQGSEAAASPLLLARPLSRREFLIRVGGASATLTVIGAAVGRYLEVREERNYQALVRQRRAAAEAVAGQVDLPNRDDPVIPVPGTRPEYTPLEDHYRIDINLRPQELDAATWRLRLGGLVERPLELTLDEIVNDFTRLDRYVTLSCISNPRRAAGRSAGACRAAARSDASTDQQRGWLLRDGIARPGARRPAPDAHLRLGWHPPAARARLPAAPVYSGSLRHEAAQVDHRDRGHRGG